MRDVFLHFLVVQEIHLMGPIHLLERFAPQSDSRMTHTDVF